jgi:glycerol uptake facilitator-like aquaporin
MELQTVCILVAEAIGTVGYWAAQLVGAIGAALLLRVSVGQIADVGARTLAGAVVFCSSSS